MYQMHLHIHHQDTLIICGVSILRYVLWMEKCENFLLQNVFPGVLYCYLLPQVEQKYSCVSEIPVNMA